MTLLTSIFPYSYNKCEKEQLKTVVFVLAGSNASFIIFIKSHAAFLFCSATLPASSLKGSYHLHKAFLVLVL